MFDPAVRSSPFEMGSRVPFQAETPSCNVVHTVGSNPTLSATEIFKMLILMIYPLTSVVAYHIIPHILFWIVLADCDLC